MTRSRGKKDANQDDIVEQCRKVGMKVCIISQFKGHEYDLDIGWKKKWIKFEVKNKHTDNFTEKEIKFEFDCNIKGLPYAAVTSFEEVLEVFK